VSVRNISALRPVLSSGRLLRVKCNQYLSPRPHLRVKAVKPTENEETVALSLDENKNCKITFHFSVAYCKEVLLNALFAL